MSGPSRVISCVRRQDRGRGRESRERAVAGVTLSGGKRDQKFSLTFATACACCDTYHTVSTFHPNMSFNDLERGEASKPLLRGGAPGTSMIYALDIYGEHNADPSSLDR